MAKVLCEECDTMIELPKLSRRVLKGLAYEFYFHCPECNHKYISYYTDQKIRRDIKRNVKKRERHSQSKTTEESREMLAEINMNEKLIKKDMDALKEKMQREILK